jgi:hypothetical protein
MKTKNKLFKLTSSLISTTLVISTLVLAGVIDLDGINVEQLKRWKEY